MRIYAFQGWRYAAGADPDPGRLIAPPYDQIPDGERDRLQAISPYQFAHLTRPVSTASEPDPFASAAALHRSWAATGAIARDEVPSLYPYSIELAQGGARLGLTALVGYEPPDVIRPHEQTLDKPLAERLALLRAMKVDLEPVLLLPDDGGALDRMLAEDIARRAPVAEHLDGDGHRHVLYRLTDPQRVVEYRELLTARPAAIADGHHRYKVGMRYAEESGAQRGSAAAAKLAVLTSLAAAQLRIDPIHRALRAADLSTLHRLVVRREAWTGDDGWDFAADVAAGEQPALGVWSAANGAEIWTLDPRRAPPGVSPGAAALPVVLLQEVFYPALGLGPDAATDGTVLYRSDPAQLRAMIRDGAAAVGLFLPPMSPAQFAAAISHGDLLPPKSTRFLPKVFSGLVWAAHDSGLA
jgi:uncharacterized protein (DUF1015 family)